MQRTLTSWFDFEGARTVARRLPHHSLAGRWFRLLQGETPPIDPWGGSMAGAFRGGLLDLVLLSEMALAETHPAGGQPSCLRPGFTAASSFWLKYDSWTSMLAFYRMNTQHGFNGVFPIVFPLFTIMINGRLLELSLYTIDHSRPGHQLRLNSPVGLISFYQDGNPEVFRVNYGRRTNHNGQDGLRSTEDGQWAQY